ncbi:hypothetical protein [Hyunsoonleella ulvae]|uniref:hypothetical protein n=1 Tax=Hyunsoonleella ulvae TaxID=2799948 RepID=UPI00193A311E|nr:hypothetical protein [Hyunsoonleella ulvae]
MKSIKVFIFVLFSFLLNSYTLINNRQHIGKWMGKDNHDIGYLILDKEGYASFEINGKVLGGKESYRKQEKVKMEYQVDYSKNPIEIDLIISTIKTNKEQERIKGIIEFISTEKMILALQFNSTGERPENFTKNNSITLHKEIVLN